MSRVLYLDCPSGISGDMTVAALLGLGLPLEHLRGQLGGLGLSGWEIGQETVQVGGLAALRFTVRCRREHAHRTLADIEALIRAASLPAGVTERAINTFGRLAQAEGRVHGQPPETVTFHEVGALDSIIDIVGAAIGLEYLDVCEVHASPLPLGSGFVESGHGRLPLPAPATLELLAGVPVYGAGVEGELVTPTGAALLVANGASFGPWPAMVVERSVSVTGSREFSGLCNLLRAALGRAEDPPAAQRLIEAAANLDDQNPETWPFVIERLLAAGALDAWLTPIVMKKGRPGVSLGFLCRPEDQKALSQVVFNQTRTLGLRLREVSRLALARTERLVQTPWGEVRVKEAAGRAKPEYEDCAGIARRAGLPLIEIYRRMGEILGRE